MTEGRKGKEEKKKERNKRGTEIKVGRKRKRG